MTGRKLGRWFTPTSFAVWIALLIAVAAIYASRVCAAGQNNEPSLSISEQSVAQARSNGQHAVKHASDFHWQSSPADDLQTPGPKTVHLAHCPPGVIGAEPEYWAYLSGSGAAEAVKVTGGTCKGDDQAGTLSFTTQQAHPRGTLVSSASSGLQEASIAARWPNQVAPSYLQGGKVLVPPQEFKIFAPVSFLTINQTIDFSGSMFECWVANDACIKVGTASNYNATTNVTLINPRGRPTQAHGHQAMIAVYGQKTRIFNLMTMMGVRLGKEQYGSFGTYVSVIADQAFLLDGVDTTAGWGLECSAAFCGTLISAPGPFGGPPNAAVGWIKHGQISMQCMGNGVDWQSGNTLRISDSVIQGYGQFGVRGGLARGGYGTIMMDNVYMEDSGACPNPLGNIGTAGVIVQGGKLSFHGGEGPSGHVPQFAKSGNTRYEYFLVARSARFGASNLLYAGFAMSNGSGPVTVTTPDVPGATSFDLVRMTFDPSLADVPHGEGNYLIAGNVSRTSTCAGGVCTFTDPMKPPAAYSVPVPSYFPKLDQWPGSLVLSSAGDGDSPLSPATATLGNLNGYRLQSETNVLGSVAPAVISDECLLSHGSPLWISCFTASLPPTSLYEQNALVLATKPNHDGNLRTNLKGRINLSSSGSGPSHFITLVDSNFEKTTASMTSRPANDANDTYIGYDQGSGNPASIGLSFGAPQSISNYIGGVGDGKSWKERLTGKQKTFAVPVAIQSGNTLTVGEGSPISQMKLFTAASIPAASVPSQSCLDLKGNVPGLVASDQILGITPPKALGNLSLNAYAGAAGTLVLHFCNPTSAAASTPSGAYTFLGVH